MKDAKPEVITVAKYIHAVFYQDGEFEIRFQTIRNRNNGEMIFEFNKFKRIKCCLIQDGFKNRPSTDTYKNYKDFRYMIDLYGKNRDIPAWLKSLALWKFDKPTKDSNGRRPSRLCNFLQERGVLMWSIQRLSSIKILTSDTSIEMIMNYT